jgi:membrane protein DedA with SNARE-associated domain
VTRILSGLPLFLALSAVQAQVAKDPPADESNLVGTIIFIILFVACCAGFAWFVWKNEQKAKGKKELQGGGTGPKA